MQQHVKLCWLIQHTGRSKHSSTVAFVVCKWYWCVIALCSLFSQTFKCWGVMVLNGIRIKLKRQKAEYLISPWNMSVVWTFNLFLTTSLTCPSRLRNQFFFFFGQNKKTVFKLLQRDAEKFRSHSIMFSTADQESAFNNGRALVTSLFDPKERSGIYTTI